MANSRQTWAGLSIFLFTVLILCYPRSTYTAASQALTTWWEIILPSLFPFFFASALLARLGIIQLVGNLVQPAVRRVFNLPGAAAVVIAMGYSSGPPVAASLIAEIRRLDGCTREEGEALLCFTHNASPLFLLSAVPVAMLGNPFLGPPLASAHYLANLTLGLVWCRYRLTTRRRIGLRASPWPQHSLDLGRAPERPLAGIASEAIWRSFKNLALVGGYITVAAVLLAVLEELGVTEAAAHLAGRGLALLSLDPSLGTSLVKGMVEMTLGVQEACRAPAPLADRLIAVSLILGWSGLSVHGQVASMLAGTDLRILPYIMARVTHGALAALYLWLFLSVGLPAAAPQTSFHRLTWAKSFEVSLTMLAISLFALLVLTILGWVVRRS